MAIVLDYIVVPANGLPETVEAIDHVDALGRYVKGLLGLVYRPGEYEPEDGEEITVIGPDQEEYTRRWYAERRYVQLREAAARTTYRKGDMKPAEAKRQLADLDMPPEAERYMVRFRLNHVVRIEPEYLSGLPEHLTAVKA